MQKENMTVVSCPPCGEKPLAPEGFYPGVGLPTKRGLFNKDAFLTTPLPACGVLPPQGGQLTSHGFTLIELLVVVLIIGILAAVAVPQYRVAVAKVRYTRLKHLVKAIVEAEEVYYLANERYTPYISSLDVTLPEPTGEVTLPEDEENGRAIYRYEWGRCSIQFGIPWCDDDQANLQYTIYPQHITEYAPYAGKQKCSVRDGKNGVIAHKVCKQDSGLTAPTTGGWFGDSDNNYVW